MSKPTEVLNVTSSYLMGTVHLDWDAPASADQDGYTVKRYVTSAGSGTAQLVATITESEFNDFPASVVLQETTGLDLVGWSYIIYAFNGDGESVGIIESLTTVAATEANVDSIGVLHPDTDGGSGYGYPDITKSSSEVSGLEERKQIISSNLHRYEKTIT